MTTILHQAADDFLNQDLQPNPVSRYADASPFVGSIDPRLQNLSYSSMLTLHSCPRKFQLNRLNALSGPIEESVGGLDSQLTFAFGHLVGTGLQDIFDGHTPDEAIWKAFLSWPMDLLFDNPKQNKSFWNGVWAILKLEGMIRAGFFDDYELVYWNGKPAVELSFCVTFPNGFKYRGFVDAVLRKKSTGQILILECKTSSSNYLSAAMFKNSAQALGYSVVLDVIFPELNSYQVLYMPYMTKAEEWETLVFTKTYLQRALWIRELMLDIDSIVMYETAGVYPMRGESCNSWNRECEYFQVCTLDTGRITKPYQPPEQVEEFQINLTLNDLIQAQLAKSELTETLEVENEQLL